MKLINETHFHLLGRMQKEGREVCVTLLNRTNRISGWGQIKREYLSVNPNKSTINP